MMSRAKKTRVLLGLFPESASVDGSASFNDAVLNGIKDHCDVSIISYTMRDPRSHETSLGNGSLVKEAEFRGLPALKVSPISNLSFDISKSKKTREANETRCIAKAISSFARKRDIDVIHVLQWLTLKSAFTEGALLSGCRVVHTPYDYWAVCPTYFLRYQNRYNECDGPDASGAKCYHCQVRGGMDRNAEKVDNQNRIRRLFINLLGAILYRKPLLRFFSRRSFFNLGYRFELQVQNMERLEATKRFYAGCDRILPMTTLWGETLATLTGVGVDKFHVCPPGAFKSTERLPKGDRFENPIKIGHLHRTSHEGGTFFVLKAWAAANIKASSAKLVIYAQPGGEHVIRRAGFSTLIDNESVQVKEGRIADQMADALMPLAAIVTGYQWNIGACGNSTASSYGIPTIASDWRFEGYERESSLRENSNCIFYKKWDVDSLAETFKRVSENPAVLENIFDNFEMPSGFTHDDFCSRLLSAYQNCLV
jgi:hypothetical protein